MPNVGEGEKKSKAHYPVCTYATALHALLMYPKTENPIKIKKKKKENVSEYNLSEKIYNALLYSVLENIHQLSVLSHIKYQN